PGNGCSGRSLQTRGRLAKAKDHPALRLPLLGQEGRLPRATLAPPRSRGEITPRSACPSSGKRGDYPALRLPLLDQEGRLPRATLAPPRSRGEITPRCACPLLNKERRNKLPLLSRGGVPRTRRGGVVVARERTERCGSAFQIAF